MAITKIHPISSTLKKAIDYITNTNKTDEKILVSSFACTAEVADIQFEDKKQGIDRQGSVLAHHLIQSFLPGEVDPEKAHEIGKELADRHLQGNYQYVISTHVDKGHIHNHIIFNSVSFVTKRHYHSNSKSYYQIRNVSDQLCKENLLSIVIPNDKGKSYYEYQQFKQGTSYKQKLKKIIDNTIPISKDFDDLLDKLERLGYEIKRGKYVSCRASDQERFTRIKTLGNDYTEEAIKDRIARKLKPFPFKKKKEIDSFIDINQQKFKDNKGLEFWAKKQNLKLMARSMIEYEQNYDKYHEIESAEETALTILETTRHELKEAQTKYRFLNVMIDYEETRNKYKTIYDGFKTSKDKTKYSVEHSREIALYKAAVTEIKKHYPNGVIPTLESMIIDRNKLNIRINELTPKYDQAKKDYAEISKLKRKIDMTAAKENNTKDDINHKYVKEEI